MRALALLAVICGATALAVDAQERFDDPALEERYRELLHEIRCMQCQNQSIADSPSDTAGDIRRIVRERMERGDSDSQIKTYLASRYGDFILYQPPLKPSTWLLWAAPGLLLVAGGVIFARTVRARMRQPLDEDIG